MHYQIIVPLSSTDVLLEFQSEYTPFRSLEPSFYTYVSSKAFGPIKVFAHKIQEGDPMKLTLEKLRISASQWDDLIKENGLILTQLEATIARIDTLIAQKVLSLDALPNSSPEYVAIRSQKDDLSTSKINLQTRHHINSLLADLVRMSNTMHTDVHFEL